MCIRLCHGVTETYAHCFGCDVVICLYFFSRLCFVHRDQDQMIHQEAERKDLDQHTSGAV